MLNVNYHYNFIDIFIERNAINISLKPHGQNEKIQNINNYVQYGLIPFINLNELY